jgi:hypothetical protein
LLQLWVGGVFADFAADEVFFRFIDAPVSLGGGDQGTQYRVAVGFDLRAGEQSAVCGSSCGAVRAWLRCQA